MVEALVYILFSIVEGLIIVYFSFGLFRIKAMDYWKEILVTVSTISAATYYYSLNDALANVAPLLNILALFLALVLVFRISLLHSLYIAVAAAMGLLTIQFLLAKIGGFFLDMTLDEIRAIDWLRFSFQITSDSILLLISNYLQRKRLWFVFVPYESKLTFNLSKLNLMVLLSSVLGIILLSNTMKLDNLTMGTLLSLFCLAILIYVGIKIEMSDEV